MTDADIIKAMEKRFQELINEYQAAISCDHHKSRDYFFTVEKVFTPDGLFDEARGYRFEHRGYISERRGCERKTYKEALQDGINAVLDFIAEYRKHQNDFA